MSKPVTLASLEPGRTAVIGELAFDEPDAVRVMELGFIPGAPVSCQRFVPLGDVAVYQVDGAMVAIRRETAAQIEIVDPQTVRRSPAGDN